MSTTPPPQGRARSADDVQADISALMQETGGWLWGPDRTRYRELRDEWIAAVREEMTTAA